MKRVLVFSTLCTLVLAACGAQVPPTPPPGQPTHPLLDGLEPPPLNQPITVTGIPVEPPDVQLPEDDRPALFLLQNGTVFAGEYQASGSLLVSPSLIEITPADQKPPLQILYRAPGGMTELQEATVEGEVSVVELSRPEAADREVIVRDEKGLLLVEVWRASEKPIQFDTGGDLQFVQEAVDPGEDGEYTEANLAALSGNEPIAQIPVGDPVTLETSEGVFQVFVEVSHLFTPSPADQGQHPMSYILHLWLIRQ
jgi:hypothetical protein